MIFQQIRGATIKVTFAGKTFLIDPWLADKGAFPPVPSPYNDQRNPLVGLPLPIEKIIDADAVIVTHMHHFDHFDEAARKALPKDRPIFTQSDKEVGDMRDLGFSNVTALRDDGLEFEGVTLYRTDGEHGQGEAAERNYEQMGLPGEASGVVFSQSGEPTVYVAGDTIWSAGVEEAITKHQPAVIILNVAQAAFQDGTPILIGTDGLHQASQAAPKAVIIASHLDAVNHARLTRDDIRKFVAEHDLSSRVRVPQDGETYSF